MRNPFLIIGIALLFGFSLAGESLAFWIWSPKTKKLERPEKGVKAAPSEQLAFGLSFFQSGNYERALREMENLIDKYPASKETVEAQYYVGRSYEGLENYYTAFKAYEKLTAHYPNSQRIGEVIEREYRIGNLFYSGKKRKIAGLEILPSLDKAIEIFRRVVEQSPYGPHGVLSQYKLGECYKKNEDYPKAEEAFEKLIEEYPTSELVDEARYQIALVSFRMSRKAPYDSRATDEAIAQFSRFVKEHPQNDLVPESLETIQALQDRKAEKTFETAQFYEKQGKTTAARLYYNQVIEQHGKSPWAQQALERLTILGKKSVAQ